MAMPSYQDIDRIKVELYNHYYSRHKELFNRNILDYWLFARRYIEKGIQQFQYFQATLDDLKLQEDGLEDRVLSKK